MDRITLKTKNGEKSWKKEHAPDYLKYVNEGFSDSEKELAELWFANLDKDAKLSNAEQEIAELWFEILKGDE